MVNAISSFFYSPNLPSFIPCFLFVILFFFFLNIHFLLTPFSFGKDCPAQKTLTTQCLILHKNLAVTVYSCSSRDLLTHPTQSKMHMHTWFLLWVPDCFKVPSFISVFLWSHLIHHFYTRAGLCKVEIKQLNTQLCRYWDRIEGKNESKPPGLFYRLIYNNHKELAKFSNYMI